MDKEEYWLAHPFNEAPWYGTHDIASVQNGVRLPMEVDADMSKVTVPFQSVDSIEHGNHQHIKGEIEAYLAAASKDKQLFVVTGDDIGGWMFTEPALHSSVRFFDYWLKGIKNGVMDEPKVRMMIRTGDGGWYWQNENEYPIARTDYRKYDVDATPASWAGDGKRSDFLKLSSTPPTAKASKSYSADVNESRACWQPGISFVTEPMPEDTTLAGFIKLHLWVSSTSSDADIFASMRVMDKNNTEIPYGLLPRGGYYPVGEGQQKVSHRALDKNKSTLYRPWTTDTKADYAPLKSPDEVVPVDVELEPITALIHKGDRIRLDIQPVEGCDYGAKDSFPYAFTGGTTVLANAEPYQKGATNTIYTGADHTSYLQLPVIPAK